MRGRKIYVTGKGEWEPELNNTISMPSSTNIIPSMNIYMCVCVCVCVCARARERACVHELIKEDIITSFSAVMDWTFWCVLALTEHQRQTVLGIMNRG
jgi:hypothetical protein